MNKLIITALCASVAFCADAPKTTKAHEPTTKVLTDASAVKFVELQRDLTASEKNTTDSELAFYKAKEKAAQDQQKIQLEYKALVASNGCTGIFVAKDAKGNDQVVCSLAPKK